MNQIYIYLEEIYSCVLVSGFLAIAISNTLWRCWCTTLSVSRNHLMVVVLVWNQIRRYIFVMVGWMGCFLF